MGDRCALHHLEMVVDDGLKTVTDFVLKFGFVIHGERKNNLFRQWLIRASKCVFIVTEIQDMNQDFVSDPYVPATHGLVGNFNKSSHDGSIISTVNNVALEVKNIESYLEKLKTSDVQIVQDVIKLENQNGYIKFATVKSCLENIVHSIVEVNGEHDDLLPGFSVPSQSSISLNLKRAQQLDITHVDHVTFVCETGRSSSVISWYERCFGMKNFSLNNNDPSGSLVVNGPNVGLRLSAFDYWRCAETGLSFPGKNKLTFVIAEPFGGSGHSHVKTFMKQHNGPGVQHIGLHTNNIISTIETLKNNHVEFVEPPYTYYDETYFIKKVEELGESLLEDINDLKRLGILLDSEDQPIDDAFPEKYLMQMFTKPIFDQETFFLEIIQRRGAQGFGSGNIVALCRAVEKLKSTQASG